MEITLDQQYNVGEKPTVILYTYINRYAGTPENCCIKTTNSTLAASLVQVQCTEFLCDVHITNSTTVVCCVCVCVIFTLKAVPV